MRIRCLHGFFIFDELEPGEISRFKSLFGLGLAARGESFTFEGLAEAPDFAIAGGLYMGAPATVTYEGEPWEIMRENALVYSIDLGKVVPILSITAQARAQAAGNYFVAQGLLQPGAVTEGGARVKDYAAHCLFDAAVKFKYSEINYE